MAETLIGRPAPGFEIPVVRFGSDESETVSLSSFAGEWLLLLFYPRDFSFVCPTELTAFSAHIDAFHSRQCRVLAVSVDRIEDHVCWFTAPESEGGIGPLRFPLGADVGGVVSRAYGVWLEEHQCSARGLFIIEPDGVLQYAVVHSSSVGRSTEETLRVLDALRSGGLCPARWTSADGTIDAEAQLQPGRVLGHYRIVEKLGAGSFGSVLAAHDMNLDRRVAIKIIGRKADVAKEVVLNEARAAAQLNHPNICTVFAVEAIDAVPVIVMEYISGSPLAEIDIAGCTGDQRRSIALGVASGLAEAHRHGVVHGDLKPANVMITEDWQPRLLDFGLARRSGVSRTIDPEAERTVTADGTDPAATVISEVNGESGSQQSGRISGTPAYMSPEQTRGQQATAESDVFAFGLLLTELLTGRPAVEGANVVEVLEQIRSGAVRSATIERVPEPFRGLLSRMLADGPDERPETSLVTELLAGMDFSAKP